MAKDKIKEPALEEEVLEDVLVQESLLEPDEDDLLSNDETEEEDKKLNSQKIFYLIGIGVLSFLLFVFITFPLNEIVRAFLTSSFKDTGILLEAKEIKFPIFGRKFFDSFAVRFPSGTVLKAEETSLSLSLLGLINYKLEGDADISFFKYEGGEWSVQIKSLQIPIKLSGLEDRITKWNGEGEIQFSGGKFFESMEIPLLGSLKGQEIKRGSFQFKIRSGKLSVEKGTIDSSVAKIQINGVIRLSDVITLSQLDLRVCFSLNEQFAKERQDIAGLFTLIPQENGRACVPIRGSVSSPKVDVPNFNQLGVAPIQTEESGNPSATEPAPANP
ncbi:type II secretion system protein GspN [Leptospira idonii]|uniref:Type II secretion system protein GspN n=1 Tax=Leptospira idonii TaxID=1193500 RepID=A0A4R9LWE2_9LEPT|nr:type II secretion system protein GspN [Leptospira idonii]TGN18550.1 type II secretion system protein GspN [Leptospira idonii]